MEEVFLHILRIILCSLFRKLLPDTFLMYGLQDFLDKTIGESQRLALVDSGFNDLLVTLGLDYLETMLLLVLTNLARDVHATCQHSQQFVVAVVNLLAQQRQFVTNMSPGTDLQTVDDAFQLLRGDLLKTVA